MEVYKIPIEFAFIVFPFIAFILTIPFLIHQYRKYGAIPFLKSSVFYSLILYLICTYFLVVLPLPSIEEVAKMTTPKMQLTLFQFIKDIIVTIDYDIDSLKAILKILKNPTVYTVLFNIVLTLPFGVYLRYFFKKKWYKTLLYTFLLSLFFEITQLSGLYGIYPRPYRLFDVDDLLINSLGGLIGYTLTPFFTLFLPSREQLEEKSYKKGTRVTLLRRFMAFFIDVFILSILCLITKILFHGTTFSEYYSLITLSLYYMVIPLFTSGKTFGKNILRLKIAGLEGNIKWYQILARNFLLIYFSIYPFVWIDLLQKNTSIEVINRLWIVVWIYQITNIVYYISNLSKKNHLFLYEKITNSLNVSTIENEYLLKVESKKELKSDEMEQLSDIEKESSATRKNVKRKNSNNCKTK